MKIKDIARTLPDEIWSVFEPILPPTVWTGNGRKPYSNHSCLHGILYVLVSGIPWEMMPAGFPSYKTCQRRFDKGAQSECFLDAWRRLAEDYELQRGINGDQLCIDGSKHPSKKRGETTGPSPVDRGKCGTNIHLARDGRSMPPGVVITGAKATDGSPTGLVLEERVVRPPDAESSADEPQAKAGLHGDGA